MNRVVSPCGTLSSMMRVLRGVFYFEVISNLGSAGLALFLPATFLAQLTSEPLPTPAVEFVRWYAVVLVVLSLVLLAALRARGDEFLRPVVAAYLLGDGLQIAVSIRFGEAAGVYPVAVHAAIWTSVFYAVVRILYLRRSGS